MVTTSSHVPASVMFVRQNASCHASEIHYRVTVKLRRKTQNSDELDLGFLLMPCSKCLATERNIWWHPVLNTGVVTYIFCVSFITGKQ